VRSVLPLVAAQGGLRLRAEAQALLGRTLLARADADSLRAGGADWCVLRDVLRLHFGQCAAWVMLHGGWLPP
jgi:hypothetical protein